MKALLGMLISAGVLSASAQTAESYHYTAGAKVDGAGRPRAMFGLTARVGNGNAESSARTFLQRHASTLGLADAIAVLGYLFAGGPQPPPPAAACGADPVADALPCATFPPCQ